jgi:hypothetical protein
MSLKNFGISIIYFGLWLLVITLIWASYQFVFLIEDYFSGFIFLVIGIGISIFLIFSFNDNNLKRGQEE